MKAYIYKIKYLGNIYWETKEIKAEDKYEAIKKAYCSFIDFIKKSNLELNANQIEIEIYEKEEDDLHTDLKELANILKW